ncbi:MAG: phosphoglycerate dehydrogenase [Deltaproteobacteria bacterium]|nr:phosphoglycerate dehydrogenase [Deltaproteobacteria bacterium]NND27463.1 phosphoglycerate dehydrogenase [Myxococcales bacterium]MBT8465457.1 phosphoglycerate dehydrogenase [Deltaproteobacteria bacterium]MBT8482036.1 phosphoglycerate dehydrogenase [Deltaproteobacteria bacterium]NNK07559.1 phosphoglycerate dehydrogenase [Myxococcales bacterium]
MSNVRVLVSDKLAEAGLQVLRDAPGVDLEFRPGMSEDELCEIIGDYDGLIIRSATQVTARVIDKAGRLRVVGRAGIGVDNVDIPAASRRGIVVMNTPTGNSVTTAEHALALLASLARRIPQAVASMRGGKWEKSKFQGREIAFKTLGVIGLGNIGRIVADRAQGLKMKVIGVDPVMSSDRAAELGIELVELDELLERADFVTIHAPLTPETKNMISDAAFKKMKSSALLVNAARGGIVDEEALARAMGAGEIAGAALDVFSKEPIDSDHPLLGLDNVLCTPHLGASTSEAQERVAVEIAEQAIGYLQLGIVKNAVNVPALPQEIAERLKPYLDVAKLLGSLVGQLDPVDVRELRVTCTGEAGELGVTPIARAALAGFLEHHLEEPVNPISAPYEAQERGIRLAEVKEASHRYATTVRVTVTGEKGIHTATGTPGRKGEPRLVDLEGYEIDAVMGGPIVIIRNEDRPGVIGSVGTLLGKRGINVSRMQVGLDSESGQALAIWNVDSMVGSDALDEIRSTGYVSSVHTLRL